MPDLKSYRQEMLARVPGRALGRAITPTSMTATTIVANALAYGREGPEKYEAWWLVRPDAGTASAADRIRQCDAFTSSSGTLRHAGTNYTDTTVTSETVELLPYEPFLYDNAIDVTLRRTRRLDRSIIPTKLKPGRYWLGDLSWIASRSDIDRICWRADPVLTDNRYFEKWNDRTTAGVLQPDNWTIAGASGTVTRSTTQNLKSRYSAALLRSGTTVTLTQTPGLLITGVAGDALRSKSVTAVLTVWASTASQVRVQISDGVTTTSSSYHTGGSGWETLTATATVGAAATSLLVRASHEVDGTVYIDEMYILGNSTYDDTVIRDDWREYEIAHWQFEANGATPALVLPEMGNPGQFVIYSWRAYPGFDAPRLLAGTGDADVSDAPLVTIATGAIGRLYEALAQDKNESERAWFAGMSTEWEKRFENMALEQGGDESASRREFGLPLPPTGMMAPAARRR